MMKQRGFVSLVSVGLIMFLLGVLIASPPQELRALAPSAKATPTISKKMNANRVDNLHASKDPVKNKLVPLDGNAKFPSSVIPDDFQKRIASACPENSAIRSIDSAGDVICESIQEGVNTPTPINTPVNTPTPINTAVNTPTPINTPVNTPTPINTPVNTPTPINTAVNTPTPINTPVNTPTPINTPLPTPTPLNLSSDGFVKAGVFAMCDGTNSTIYRSFNNVNSNPVTIVGGLLGHNCIIDFGFDDSNRYIVVTPVYHPDNIVPIRAVVKDDFGTWVVVTLWNGTDEYVGGKIFVQVY